MWKPSLRARSLLPWLLAVAAPWVGAAGVLFGVVALGRMAQQHFAGKDAVEVAAIECAPPDGMSRKDFLDQVQYYAELPDRLAPSDALPQKLMEAFYRHPWVERVERITRLPDNRMRVQLAYRTPALVVEVNGQKRAVDGNGILLPTGAVIDGLPVLRQGKIVTAGREGTLLGDERVRAAARTAAFLRTDQVKLDVKEISDTGDGLVLTTALGTRILWGRPLIENAGTDLAAERKRERLRSQAMLTGQVDLRGEDTER